MAASYKTWQTGSLNDHVGLIRRQIGKSMEDPETRSLAARLVSGVVDWVRDPRTGAAVAVVTAWGRPYRAPPGAACPARDSFAPRGPVSPAEACEVQNIWDFMVQNVRYTEDPVDADLYMSAHRTLESGAGDCDDFVVCFASLLKSIGYQVSCRIVSVNGDVWDHIYTLIHLPKNGQTRYYLPLDPTEPGKPAGWHYDKVKAQKDFVL